MQFLLFNNPIVYYTLKGAFIKGLNRKLLEALVLFFILFFPKNAAFFSFPGEIGYSIFWRVPALILVLLLLDKKPLFSPKKDLIVLTAALCALMVAGFLVSLAAAKTGFSPPIEIPLPAGIPGWIGVILLSLSIGALEEAYFRVYLPQRILELFQASSVSSNHPAAADPSVTNRFVTIAFLLSGIIFALCHVYEGFWGVANALLASLTLSFIYIKSSSFPGIALAHGLYNVFVFLIAALH